MKRNKVQFKFCAAQELYEFRSELLNFEKEFIYPLNEKENFYISHGKNYSDFFERMGDSRYLLAFLDHQIVGMISVVKKKITFLGKKYSIFYLADLKIKKEYRGKSLSHQFYWELLKLIPVHPYAWQWSFCYFVGMMGKKGDVSHSFGQSLPAKLVKSLAYLKIYFIEPEKLAALPKITFFKDQKNQRVLNLSSFLNSKSHSMTHSSLFGIKDIVLESSGLVMKIAHVNLDNLTDDEVIQRLQMLGQMKFAQPFQQFCFALDERRKGLIDQLKKQQIIAQSRAHVFGFSLFPHLMKYDFLTLNSDEI